MSFRKFILVVGVVAGCVAGMAVAGANAAADHLKTAAQSRLAMIDSI